jgi:hypothetical protein
MYHVDLGRLGLIEHGPSRFVQPVIFRDKSFGDIAGVPTWRKSWEE